MVAHEETPETPETPAVVLAVLLEAVAAHLRRHPGLPVVNVPRNGELQILTYPHRGETLAQAAGVLAWADTLTDPTITIRPSATPDNHRTAVQVSGLIGGVAVQVWDVDEGDLYRWYQRADDDPDSYRWTPLTRAQLAAYLAAGTTGTDEAGTGTGGDVR